MTDRHNVLTSEKVMCSSILKRISRTVLSCSAWCNLRQLVCTYASSYVALSYLLLEIRSGFKVDCWFRFALDLDLLFVLCYFVPVLSAFVVGLVS